MWSCEAVIAKACRMKILVEATPKYGEGINLKVPVRISFHGIAYFFNKEKLENAPIF